MTEEQRTKDPLLPGCLDRFGWRPMRTAPRDGSRILACVVTPVEYEDTGETKDERNISVVYWVMNSWMEWPARPKFLLGQRLLAWQPLPPFTQVTAEAEPAHPYRSAI